MGLGRRAIDGRLRDVMRVEERAGQVTATENNRYVTDRLTLPR
jgi:hypothetical protein